MNDFWPGPEKPFSPQFWWEVWKEKRRLKKCKRHGHEWIPLTLSVDSGGNAKTMHPLVMECQRCGDRRVAGEE